MDEKKICLVFSLLFFSLFSISLVQAPYIELTFNFTTIEFGTLQEDTVNNPASNNYNISVNSSSDCNAEVTFYSPLNPFTYSTYTIPNINFKFNYTINTTAYPTLLTLDQNRTITGVNNSFIYPDYYLDVPSTHAGTYTTSFIISGVCV